MCLKPGSLFIQIAFITLLINKAPAITNKVSNYPKDFVRHSAPNPPTDWESGLREAANQALVREKIANPALRENLLTAPIIGRKNWASPFGDIAILAKGKLINAPSGLQFVQENNDCIECNLCDETCKKNKNILALWMVKRVRHRDENYGHRYELEYVISPTNSAKRHPRFDNNYGIAGHIFVVKSNPSGGAQNFFKIYSQDKNNYITNVHKEPQWYDPHELQFPPIHYEQQAAPPLENFKDIKPVTEATDLHQLQKPIDGFYQSQPNFRYLPVQPQYNNYIPPTQQTPPDDHENHQTEIDLYKNLVHTLAQKTSTFKLHPTKETRFKLNENTPPTKKFHNHFTTNNKETNFEQVNYITRPTKFSKPKTTVFVPDYRKTTQIKPSIYVPDSDDDDDGRGPSGASQTTQDFGKDFTQEQLYHQRYPSTEVVQYTPTMTDITQFPQQTEYSQYPSTKSHYQTTPNTFPTHFTDQGSTYSNPANEASISPTNGLNLETTHAHFETKKPTYPTTLEDTQKSTNGDFGISKPAPTFYIDYNHPGYPRTTPTTSFTDRYNQNHATDNVNYAQTDFTREQDKTTPSYKDYHTQTTLNHDYRTQTTPNHNDYHTQTTPNHDFHTQTTPNHDYHTQTTPNFVQVPIKTHKPKRPIKQDFDDNLEELFPNKNYANSITTTKHFEPSETTKSTGDFLFRDNVYTTRKSNKNKKVEDADIFGKDATTRKTTPKDEFELITPVVVKTKSRNDSLETLETKVPNIESTTPEAKIIYSDFYVASTANPTTNLEGFAESTTIPTTTETGTTPKTTKKNITNKRNTKYSRKKFGIDSNLEEKVVSTTQSYNTSISFEVGKKNAEELVENTTSKISGNAGLDPGKYNDIALSLINNAKSIDYLENQTKRPKYRRKIYTRTKKLRKKIVNE